MSSRILRTAVVLAASLPAQAFATTINLSSGDVITLSPNTTTTVTCNGGADGDNASASFSCDASTNLTIDLVNAAGAEQEKTVFVGSLDTCNQTAGVLSQRRAHIYQTTVIAVCDASTDLMRFALLPSGTINQLNTTYIGNLDSCLAQAKTINGG